MSEQLISPLYLRYEPKSANEKPIAYEITTVEGLAEVASLVKMQTGHVYFIDEDEFHQSIEAERITDDCTKPVGMAWNTDEDSVFYVYVR